MTGRIASVALALWIGVSLIGCQSQPSAPATQAPAAAAPTKPAASVTQAPAAAPTQAPAASATQAPAAKPTAAPATSSSGLFDEAKQKDLIAAAKKEGELVLYATYAQTQNDPWLKAFGDKFGIKATSWRGELPQIRERMAADFKAGKGPDVISVGGGNAVYDPWFKDGLLMPYTVANDKLFPDDLKISNYGIPIWLSESVVIMARPDGLKPDELKAIAEKPYEGLLQPSLKKKIVITEAGSSGGSLWMYYWLLEENRSKYGEDYLKKLAAQEPGIYKMSNQGAEAVAQGEFAAAMTSGVGALTMYDKGAKIQFFYPDPAPSQVIHGAIGAKAAHPNAAKLFMEWVTSREGQDFSANQVFFAKAALPGGTDQRKVAKEPWFKVPSAIARVKDWKDMDAKGQSVLTRFQTIFNYKPN